MTKSIVITSRNLYALPPSCKPIACMDIKGDINTKDNFPFSTYAIEKWLESSDHLIIAPPIFSNDDLHQGEEAHFLELVAIMIYYGALRFEKSMSVLQNNDLTTIVKNGKPEIENFQATLRLITSINHENDKHGSQPVKKAVTSIQKIPISRFQTGEEWATTYFDWLGGFMKKLIAIKAEGEKYPFRIIGLASPLLVLQKQMTFHHHIGEYAINGGWLNKESGLSEGTGRFWFVVSPDEKYLYTALIHFKPRLPWPLYSLTQAPIHEFVMERFARQFQNRF